MFSDQISELNTFLNVSDYFIGDVITFLFIILMLVFGVKYSINWATMLIIFIIFTLLSVVIGLDSNFNLITLIRDFITGEIDTHTVERVVLCRMK